MLVVRASVRQGEQSASCSWGEPRRARAGAATWLPRGLGTSSITFSATLFSTQLLVWDEINVSLLHECPWWRSQDGITVVVVGGDIYEGEINLKFHSSCFLSKSFLLQTFFHGSCK